MAGDHLRQHDIFERREFRQQMMKLVDEPDLAAPQRRAGLVSHADGRHAGDIDLAAVRPLKQPGDM